MAATKNKTENENEKTEQVAAEQSETKSGEGQGDKVQELLASLVLKQAELEKKNAELEAKLASSGGAQEGASGAAFVPAPDVHNSPRWDEKKTIDIELGRKYDDDMFVSVNGKRIQIRRGETATVDAPYAEVIANSKAQDRKAYMLRQKLRAKE